MAREIFKRTETVDADDDNPMRVALSLARQVRNEHPEYEKYHWSLYVRKTDGEQSTVIVTVIDQEAFPKINWWLVAGVAVALFLFFRYGIR